MPACDFNPLVSFYSDAFENLPTDIPAANFIASIKSGTYAGKIEVIRQRVQNATARGVSDADSKKAVDSHKKKLAAITLAGIQPMRGNKFVPQFTGLIQADFDLLGAKLKSIRDQLAADPHVFCVFISATGKGLKAWYRIPICKNADEYKFAFDMLANHVLHLTGCKIDELKEVARLCYASHDKDCFHNPNVIELPVDFAQMPSPTAKPIPSKSRTLNGESRRVIAERLLGKIEWENDVLGYLKCPGEHLHTNGNAQKDCRVTRDGVPTIFCLHKSCSQIIETANHELRSRIGKAEIVPSRTPQAAPDPLPGNDDQPEIAAPQPPVAKSLGDFIRYTENDPDELLKWRYLSRKGSLLLVGPTGIGKSSFSMQAAILWGIGRDCFGITPVRPLKSLIIQAEDDDSDIAEMRDGVIAGLNLSELERQLAFKNVAIVHENTRVLKPFMDYTVEPLLELHRPDLLWINPALSYLGGESNSQKDVSFFLRNLLNPLLTKFNCGCVVVHHTNKPSKGEEKSSWQAGDFAYLGSGSAEWANWARAVLAIRSVGSHDVFELCAGKRGARIGWKDEDGKTSFARLIGHATELGVICWRTATEDETPDGKPRRAGTREDLIAMLPLEKPVAKALLIDQWKDRFGNKDKGRAFLDAIIADGKLFEWRLARPGTNAAKLICRKPQPAE